jgi:hypothetical protein
MKKRDTVLFDRSNKIIEFNGAAIIDLGPVAGEAKARFYSKSEDDTLGYDTVFSIRSTGKPFDFGFLSLSSEGFVTAAIENRLEIEGMLVNQGLEDAYQHIRSKSRSCLGGHACRQS